jgi:AbiV family abortive infection protein
MGRFAHLKISFRKLDELGFRCFQNGLNLHFDSILLLKARSYASAFALSVIASEEIGKGFALEDMTFQARMNRGFDEEDKESLGALLSDHKVKQGWFISTLFDRFNSMTIVKRYQKVQVEKNNALYAGVRRGNHQIVRPFSIPASKAKRQVRMVNDSLLKYAQIRLRDIDFDDEVSDQIFRRRSMLKKLETGAKSLR